MPLMTNMHQSAPFKWPKAATCTMMLTLWWKSEVPPEKEGTPFEMLAPIAGHLHT